MELPPAARARLEAVLAEAELASIAAADDIPFVEANIFLTPENRPGLTRLNAAIKAGRQIVEIALAFNWPAVDRRQFVKTASRVVCDELPVDYDTFVLVRREQEWWKAFQQALRQAARTAVPLRQAARTTIPSIEEQLRALMEEACWGVKDLMAATRRPPLLEGLSKSGIERLLAGRTSSMNASTRAVLTDAFREKLRRDVFIQIPPRPRRTNAGKKPVKRR